MKHVLFLAPILILMSCTPTKTVEPSTTSGNINVYAPYMWASNAFPRNLKISNDFTATEVAQIQAMSTQWESSTENKKNFFNNTELTPEVSSANLNLDSLGDDNVNGIYKITEWPMSLSGGALAVTQLFGRRFNVGEANEYVRIEHADILINENDYSFRTDDVVANNYDFRTVVLHEMGHFLGLSHNLSSSSAVMYPSISTNSSKRIPHNLDIADLADRYNITLSSGASSAITASKPLYKPAPNDPGQMVKIMIELRADGECVHTENGHELYRHSFLKK